MNRLRAYGLTCLFLMASAAVQATTIVMPSDEQLIAKTPVIVAGMVLSTNVIDRDGAVWTESKVSVSRILKGSAPDTIVVRELGGETGERITKIFGTAELQEGEEVLLFVEPRPRGGYRTVDLFVGKFAHDKMLDGRMIWRRDDVTMPVTLLDADFEPIEAKNIQRVANSFEQFIGERVAGRNGVANYGIENPVLAKQVRTGTSGGAQENFTTISEPRIYRWFGFDSGTPARWYSSGSQSGYSGGGVSELQSGMASWTSYSAAKILYSYVGSRTGTPGGLSASNGFNEVLFDDPLNEISGTYSRGAGGVVGTGGFTGVSAGSNWNAPFTADSGHTSGSHFAYNITEGNLTIQDGVTSANGISSARLAEIIAHEFGHTLGFGHSADASALMYATLTGLGPSLKSDDQTAARWLYPNGSGGGDPVPQSPSAPSNLSGTVSGSTIELQWSDNATNESGQSIYLASGSGSFSKVADVGANVRSATLSGFAAGSYRLYVVASNSAGTSSPSNTVTVNVASQQITARFSFTPSSGTAAATTFTFYDESIGAVSSRQWNFGDGSTASGSVVTHVYAKAGQYNVTLTASGGGATSQITKTVTVSGALTAAFTFSPSSPTTNDTVAFTDQSTGGVSSWFWSFGNGATSASQNASHRYSAPGTYGVTLTVNRNSESTSITKQITVSAPVPVTPPIAAAFDVTPATPVVGSNATFNDRSTGSPASWWWSFGDGSTSTQKNPVHAYAAPGTYMVTLTASNATTSSTATKSITVSSIAPYRSLVSAAAQTNGLGGTVWRTELSLFNAGSQGANVTMLFLPGAGGTMVTRSIYLAPRQSTIYANTLLDLFGISSGAGAVAIEATSAGASAQLRVTSRTFTSGDAGTYGQSVPDVQDDALEQTLYLTGIQSNAAYRTNIGLVNRGSNTVAASMTLFDRNGATVGTADVTLPANHFQQSSLGGYFPAAAGRNFDVLSMRITVPSRDVVTAYASVIDNNSQDPVYVQAMPARNGNLITVPVVGRAGGVNGTFWRSDVTLFNPTSDRITLTLRYAQTSNALSLSPRDTVMLADILTQMGHSSGMGMLEISWNGGTGPVVTSRTYTTDERGGTFGQSIDPVAAFGAEMFVPGLRSDVNYRSNIGFVNGGSETEQFTITVLSPAGYELGSTTMQLAPKQVVQHTVTTLFPSVSGSFTLQVRGDANAKLFAYGSMVDNASGDPVFFAGR